MNTSLAAMSEVSVSLAPDATAVRISGMRGLRAAISLNTDVISTSVASGMAMGIPKRLEWLYGMGVGQCGAGSLGLVG
jgi:hypothetical protein